VAIGACRGLELGRVSAFVERKPHILVTGVAGFIGFHLARRLLESNESVVGLDNLNGYYDPTLKAARLNLLKEYEEFEFYHADICEGEVLDVVFDTCRGGIVYHLAAQAGVRYSVDHPFVYQRSNNEGFLNMMEAARRHDCPHFVYASSSSVYGNAEKVPFSEDDRVDGPISLYAATKRSNELVAHAYSHLYGMQCTGLRLFTVYGPWGRPDMALFRFVSAILADRPIDLYGQGNLVRSFSYIDDIVDGILLAGSRPGLYPLLNVGSDRSETLADFVLAIEDALGKKALINLLPGQPGDVDRTAADITRIKTLGFCPSIGIREGVQNFVDWYKGYYGI
jgi:UDP-glucuronate 4-epimerase